jgi:hypothetical protein
LKRPQAGWIFVGLSCENRIFKRRDRVVG